MLNIFHNNNIPESKKEAILRRLRNELNALCEEQGKLKKQILSSKVKTIDGVDLRTEDNNSEKARIIRNCLAHSGRTNIRREDSGKLIVEMYDYNEDGNVSSYIEVPMEKVIEFINSEVHLKSLEEKDFDD